MLEDIDKIQKYKAGLLSGDEKIAFEKSMNENQVLKKMVEEYDQYSAIADAIIEDDIIDSIKRERKYLRRKNIITIGSIILVITLLLLSYTYMIPSRNNIVYAELFEKYYSPPMGNITRSENGTVVSLKSCDLGHQLLDDKKFKEALDQFTKAFNDTETRCREKAEFYSALIHIKNKNLSRATEQLMVISKNPNHSFFSKGTQLLNDIQPDR
jgi:hypothetical protein